MEGAVNGPPQRVARSGSTLHRPCCNVSGHTTTRGDGAMPDKGPGSKSGGKKPKGGTKAGGGKKKK